MARGDHIFVRRFGGVYSHHGTDCGAGKVIHYTGYTPLQSEVRETSIEKFMNGGEVETRDDQANGFVFPDTWMESLACISAK